MPWCEDCSRFYTPSTLTPAGDCPEGHHVADPAGGAGIEQSEAAPREDDGQKIPWHFWLLVIALSIYLGWRLVQGIAWLIG
jgi:hypothetical protein